mmetsp:Transcript_3044/g.8882  ORF Transcript_3044/g.8882 Transcript_3044/m.8882 type:complete len:385 (-) Transcript_3044:233-1387(-)
MSGKDLLLPFNDIYNDLATRPTSFAGTLPSGEPSVLESLRSLGALRNAVSKASLPSTATGERVARLEKYLELMGSFSEAHPNPAGFTFDWTSPLSGQPDRFQRVTSISCEHAMTLHVYAAGLVRAAAEIVATLPAPPPPRRTRRDGDDDAEPPPSPPALDASAPGHPQAAQLLRGAAGVWDYLAEHLPELTSLPAKRQPELVAGVAAGLAKWALAQAQAVTAHRAELRASSPALLAALHAATADLIEEAAQAVKGAADDCHTIPERLKKLLALAWAVSSARAHRAWALAELSDGEAGSAVAGIDEAAESLRDCGAIAAENLQWRAIWQAETDAVAKAHASADQLREHVHFQAVAKHPSALPAGKKLVAPIVYELPSIDLTVFQK